MFLQCWFTPVEAFVTEPSFVGVAPMSSMIFSNRSPT
jgi:hypothetical protein